MTKDEKILEEDKMINEIIQNLEGTCNILDYDDYLAKGFSETKLLEKLDNQIFCCASCGWWYNLGEL